MTVKNLKDRGFIVSTFETAVQAVDYLDKKIDRETVGFGGSMTLEKMGLFETLQTHNTVYWHQKTPKDKSGAEIRALAGSAKVYIFCVRTCRDRRNINIDGNCNRVASIFYGHERVYLVVGKNKLAKDYDSALYRARNIAAPLNAKRLGMKTPCAVKADRCYDCKSPDRICCGLSVLWRKPMTGEFEVILIDEELGF